LKKTYSEFIRNAFTVVLGTSVAQVFPLAFYPVLSRLYSPEDFGLMALFMSVTAIMVIVSSGAIEQAILVCKDRIETELVIRLLLLRSIVVLLIIYFILIISINTIPFLFKFKEFEKWIIIALLTSFFTIIFNLYNEWCVKQKEFKSLAKNKIYNSSFTSLFKLLSKYCSFLSNGLIFGELIGKFLVSFISVKSMMNKGTNIFKDYNIALINRARKKFKQYPRYMMFDMLINTIGGSAHVYIIAAYFSATELGYLTLTLSLLTLPVSVISAGIKDVFRQKANDLFINEGSCRKLYLDLLKPLLIGGLVFFGILYVIVPYIFPFVLGDEWVKSGLYAQYLIPFFYFNFVSMSLGGIFVIANKIKISLYWQIFNTISTIVVLFIGAAIYKSIYITLVLYMISKSVSYILYMLLSYKYSINYKYDKN
tara:strand:+ start:205 stop:1476 length:1272 start_codon:yes stop_codon:yes gene_type:complete